MQKKIKKPMIIFSAVFLIFALVIPAAAFEGGGFYTAETEDQNLEINGELKPEFRLFTDDGDLEENLKGNLKFVYPGLKNEFKVKLDYQVGAADEIDFNEVYYKHYGEQYNFTFGKNIVVWGKGDQVHVLDNINAEDLSDFINPEYKERQLGEEMIKVDRFFRGGNANLEFIYTPNFSPHRFAKDPDSPLGNWMINPFAGQFTFRDIANQIASTETQVFEDIEDSIPEEDNQFGLRFTDSRGGTDYGFSYYHGYLRTPSYDKKAFQKLKSSLIKGSLDKSLFNSSLKAADLHYDEVDIFGFEMARVIADINSRLELAYYRTDDTAGDDPTIRNNKIAWVIGGDRDLPISNLNLNLQFTGEKILDDDQIEDNISSGKNIDLQYNQDGDYTTNRAILKLEDSYQNEKIIPELTWIYNLNDSDYILELSVDYELKQDLLLNISHKIFNGDSDTRFGQFEDNDFSSVGIEYSF